MQTNSIGLNLQVSTPVTELANTVDPIGDILDNVAANITTARELTDSEENRDANKFFD